jgi:hypothetical protein
MPEQQTGLLRNQSHRENPIGEDDEEEDGSADGDGMDELLREDITEVDGLGEVLYALQALGQLTRLGGSKAAVSCILDKIVGFVSILMLLECILLHRLLLEVTSLLKC